MAQIKSHNLSAAEKVGIGIGLSAATLAAVGGYFLYGAKNAKQNRKKVKSWMLKAKAEVLEGLEQAKHLTETEYEKLVDEVMKGYKAARAASAPELAQFAHEMKKTWSDIKKAGNKKGAKRRGRGALKKKTSKK